MTFAEAIDLRIGVMVRRPKSKRTHRVGRVSTGGTGQVFEVVFFCAPEDQGWRSLLSPGEVGDYPICRTCERRWTFLTSDPRHAFEDRT